MLSGDALEVRPARPSDDDAIGRLIAHGFAMEPSHVPATMELAGRANVRVVCDGPDPIGVATLLPMGQYFGQRRVSMTGVAAVAVAPERQREGVASTLIRSAIRELAQARVGLSTLFATTQTLYRSLGYAPAGTRFCAEIDPASLRVEERGGTLLPMDAAAQTRVRALYGAHAPSFAGFLDRSEYTWTRLLRPWAGRTPTCVLACHDNGQVEGYVSYSKRRSEGNRHILVVHDLFASSAWGYRRVWSFIAAQCNRMVEHVELHTAPHDPAFIALCDARLELSLADTWMTRIVHVDPAFGQRGYPPRLEAILDLDVYDDVVDGNNGRWRLTVGGGRGVIQPGGAGDLRTDIRGLSALYSGFTNPTALAAAGLIEGTPAALAIADTIFSSAQPWMREMF